MAFVDSFAAITAVFWCFLMMNAYILWILPSSLLYLSSTVLAFISTLLISKKYIIVNRKRILLFVIFFIFIGYGALLRGSNLLGFLTRSPMLLMVFWGNAIYFYIYRYFRKTLIVFSFFAILVFIASLLNLLDKIPYTEVEAMENAHKLQGWSLRIYSYVSVLIYDPLSFASRFVRVCGPFQEPGHFGIFLGIVYLIDRMMEQKRSVIMMVAIILTFSPAAIGFLLLAEISSVRSKKALTRGGTVFLFLVTPFLILPNSMIDDALDLIYFRNLETLFEVTKESGSVTEAMSKRATQSGLYYYDVVVKSDKIWTGMEIGDDSYVLSDYRGTIVSRGIIGLALNVLLFLAIIAWNPKKVVISFSIVFLVIILHRSWMFQGLYVYFLFLMGINANNYHSSAANAVSVDDDNIGSFAV